ncbi:hypothetical protein [Sinorhizobium arboris]|uniref:hypothetical protein n=1 Tax=Sinorhizobium arboris TaxID=76745 RepID=UPI000486B622|nr:hypothetical protein [Sinorhizobium arboris]
MPTRWAIAEMLARGSSASATTCALNASDHAAEVAVAQAAGAVIEVVIGDVVVRAGADVDEAHLQRMVRAVQST